MLAHDKILEVRRLLALATLSHRQIARQTGVSRATVGLVARGRRPDYPPRPPDPLDNLDQPLGPAVRCPGCGGLVYPPCRLCHVRRLKAQGRLNRPPRRAALSSGRDRD